MTPTDDPTGSPRPPAIGDELLTVAEIAAVLKLNPQTIRNWIDHGTLPAVRLGRRVRIKRADFDQLLANAAQPTRAVPRAAVYTAAQFWNGEPHPPPTVS